MITSNIPVFISFVFSVTFASLTLGISIGSRRSEQKRRLTPTTF